MPPTSVTIKVSVRSAHSKAPPGSPIAINNLGFRSTDGLLYGWRRNPEPREIVMIEADRTVTGLGAIRQPNGEPVLPTEELFLAGDITPDGTKMYFASVAHIRDEGTVELYTVPLPVGSGATTVRDVWDDGTPASSGDRTQNVADWAVGPNGVLYGADREGHLAELNPADGHRIDRQIGLPGGKGFGAAWFNASGILFLYLNSGSIFEIEDVAGSPSIINSYSVSSSKRNDGASCVAG